jgi:hypothetical protein
MTDAWPPCLVCGKAIAGDRDDYPHGALIFTSYGNYGSRVYDAVHDPQLLAMVCDDCALARADRIAMRAKRVVRPAWEDKGTLAEDLAKPPPDLETPDDR